jgi:thiamine pyrophosphokinase
MTITQKKKLREMMIKFSHTRFYRLFITKGKFIQFIKEKYKQIKNNTIADMTIESELGNELDYTQLPQQWKGELADFINENEFIQYKNAHDKYQEFKEQAEDDPEKCKQLIQEELAFGINNQWVATPSTDKCIEAIEDFYGIGTTEQSADSIFDIDMEDDIEFKEINI